MSPRLTATCQGVSIVSEDWLCTKFVYMNQLMSGHSGYLHTVLVTYMLYWLPRITYRFPNRTCILIINTALYQSWNEYFKYINGSIKGMLHTTVKVNYNPFW